jgi:outer membrane protein assembly factor BamB
MNHLRTAYFPAARIAAAAILALAAGAMPLGAADWPMWGGAPSRNMVNPNETGIVSEWDIETGYNVLWRAQLGSQSYGNPVIHEGKVFVGTNNGAERDPRVTGDKGILMVFDEKTGEFLWQAAHDKLAAGRVNDWPEQGICSVPFAEGNRIYYVSNRCELIAADTEGFRDGKNDGPFTDETLTDEINEDIIWKLDMIEELGVFPHNLATSSPIVIGDLIYLVTSNGVDEGHLFLPAPRAPSFIAVNKHTGEVAWESALPGRDILHGQWSSPAYGVVDGQGQVYFPGGDGWLYALHPETGDLIWKFDLNPKDSVWELGGRGTRNNIIGTPVFHENRVYLAVGQDPEHGIGPGHFYAIDATQTGDVTESGKIWHFQDLSRSISTAAVHEDLVFISDLNGFLYCLDRATGELHWKYDTLAAIWGSPTVIDGKVYIGDEDGDIAVFDASKEKNLLAENTVLNSAYTTPVAANGVLYFANRSELYALAPMAAGEAE